MSTAVSAGVRWAGRTFVYRAPCEQERCPACGSSQVSPLWLHKLSRSIAGRRLGFVDGCESCGLLFVNPQPTDAELAAMYSPDGDWSHPRETHVGRPGAGSWRHMFDGIRAQLDVVHPPSGSKVLDYGCGNGKFLDVLEDCGWLTFGIEPAAAGAFGRHTRLDEIPAAPTFDLVIVHHVLEHLTRPLELLRRLAAATRPGGFLLVSVPNFDTLPEHGDHKYMINRSHVTAYTSVCLEGLMARAGWRSLRSPAAEASAAAGARAAKRLRMLASRSPESLAVPERPLEAARASLRRFHAHHERRGSLERLGLIRLSAGLQEGSRQTRHLVKQIVTRLSGAPADIK